MAAIAETVGRLAVSVKLQPDEVEHVASSEVFKKTVAVPTLFAVWAIVGSTLHVIYVDEIVFTKQAVLPAAPL